MPRLAMSVLFLALALAPPAWASQDVSFTVLRDGTPIGHHRVQVQRQGEDTTVTVSIALDVSFGFVPLYSYRHHSNEVWRGDRLIALDSRTDDDGEAMAVTVRTTADGLMVDGPDGRRLLPPDTVPTSYWNPALVADRPLLDSQYGRLLDIDRQKLALGRWRLAGELNLDIDYDAGGRWSGLWFRHKGSNFAYQPSPAMESKP
ncbi:DUF6134 family protein [Magnetospirillum gryphiswaldense]|uniref:Secreted protein n=1 Tax=Magnetospirillum gryphiswaldense TaxID=55518 RepID=A4TU39_9PROT|nr:DUF6134 family protein [Magnetospirillum gryphiswaldense]AVM76037.1 hypothetical protein MSR1_35760 [Magnetospirillum gryphiswaldense MSR-1]AVM79940.1 hypothetical protein MSR1L_35760 [Magnetospirillum gryphiswaldense]CAM74146.1 conserved hypothetical protein, secreted [Magnetospirillum gryphiswaldense MSR-1]